MTGASHPGQLLASLDAPTGQHTRFAVIADPHVATRSTGTSKLFEQTLDHFRTAITDIQTRDVDAVLSPGDLTKDGEPWNYTAVDEVLETLSVPFYAVPGNHDVAKSGDAHESLSVDEFSVRYGPGSMPYQISVGSVDIVGINTAGTQQRLTETHDGRTTSETLTWLSETLTESQPSIVLAHHTFPPISEQIKSYQDIDSEMHLPPVMQNPGPLADVLSAKGADLVFSGHYHLPATGTYHGVREVSAPTTCSFPQAYLLCDVTPTGTTIRHVPITDEPGLEQAHHKRVRDSSTSAGLTAIAAARVASFPLVTESNTNHR